MLTEMCNMLLRRVWISEYLAHTMQQHFIQQKVNNKVLVNALKIIFNANHFSIKRIFVLCNIYTGYIQKCLYNVLPHVPRTKIDDLSTFILVEKSIPDIIFDILSIIKVDLSTSNPG